MNIVIALRSTNRNISQRHTPCIFLSLESIDHKGSPSIVYDPRVSKNVPIRIKIAVATDQMTVMETG